MPQAEVIKPPGQDHKPPARANGHKPQGWKELDDLFT